MSEPADLHTFPALDARLAVRLAALNAALYTMRAEPLRVVDGDTLEFRVFLGMDVEVNHQMVRLSGVNTPEVYGANASEAGRAAKAFVDSWLRGGIANGPYLGCILKGHAYEREKYGRLLASVYRALDGADLAADLLAAGHAVRYP